MNQTFDRYYTVLAILIFIMFDKLALPSLELMFPYTRLLIGVFCFCALTYHFAEGFPKTRRALLNIFGCIVFIAATYAVGYLFTTSLSLMHIALLPALVLTTLMGNFLISYNIRINVSNILSKNLKLLSNALRGTNVKSAYFYEHSYGSDEVIGPQSGALIFEGTQVKINLYQVLSAKDVTTLSQMLQSPSVTEIIFRTNHINAENVQDVFRLFQGSNVTYIYMNRYNIGDLGVKQLFQMLPETKISNLDLGRCNISDQGLIDLMKILNQTSVRKIDLYDNRITAHGIESIVPYIHKTSLTNLSARSQIQKTKYEILYKSLDYIFSWGFTVTPFGEDQAIYNNQLDEALAMNKERMTQVAPLLFLSMGENRSAILDCNKKYTDCINAREELLFVWGILQGMPPEIRKIIINQANTEIRFNSQQALTHFLEKRQSLTFQPK